MKLSLEAGFLQKQIYQKSCFLHSLVNNEQALQMQINNSLRSSPQRKTSYFQKYRKELDRISEQMKNKNQSSTSFSDKSETMKESSKLSSISQQKMVTPHVVSMKSSIKRSAILQPQKEPLKQPVQTKQDLELMVRETETMKEVEQLMGELQAVKLRLSKFEEEIGQKRSTIEILKKQLVFESSNTNNVATLNYAEKILAIETRMKFKKELHEDELNRLVNEKNIKHSENVQLCKFIETLEEQLQHLSLQHEKSEKQNPILALQSQEAKLQSEIDKTAQECSEVELKINNSQELRELSMNEFNKYAEVYKRELIGKQIAQTEQRVKERNNERRYMIDIERKKMLIKQKRVENFVRHRSVVEVTRIIDHLMKEIAVLKKQLEKMNNEKKLPFRDEI